MKPGLLIPALAATVAAGGALLTLRAQEDNAPAQPKQFRFEFRNDGSGPRFFRNGKEVKPDENGANPLEQMQKEMQKEMEDLMRRQMGGGGQQDNPLDDLLKQLRERKGQGSGDAGDLFQQLQKRLQGGRQSADSASRYSKHHRSSLSEWRPLVKVARESTVRVIKDDVQIALGTVVTADGYALTKASEVSGEGLECEFHDGRIVPAKVVDKLESYDLALIKLDATGLVPANFAPHDAHVGTLVAAVGVDENPIAVGIISVPARSLSEKGKGALGIQFALDADESQKGVIIGEIIPQCPAERAGLKKGDLIMAVNGTVVDFPFQLKKLVSDMRPGDAVKVRYSRDGKESDLEFTLTSRDDLMKIQEEKARAEAKARGRELPADLDRRGLDPTAQMGSTLSGNATGYPNAVQSDLTIDARDCGGPVADVDGHIVAINIARSERVSTYMIPGKVVAELLSDVHSGKFTLAKDADTLKGELREFETAIRKADEARKAAEARRAEAEAALKKLHPR